ncbi:MAG: hypothetical protein EBW73_11040, partial [Betaproteobacteria bacterium]|nr:hypothetical protein [Betaproteobacteria bacterium]
TFGTNATTSSYGTLDLMGYNLSIGNLNVSGNQALAHVQNSQSLAYSGNSILTVNQTTNGSFNGLMRNFDGSGSGTLGLTKNGSANLTLSGNNITYTGGTIVNEGTLTLGGMVTVGRGTLRGTVTVNQGATLNYTNAPGDIYSGSHSFGWDSGVSVNTLNINGGTVGGADLNNHFWGGGTFTLNMNGGELKLGGGQNPTQTMNFNVLSNNTTARVTAVTAGANLAMEGRVTFNVADGSQDVDLLVLPNLLERNGGAGKGQIMKTGAGTMRMTGTNTHEVGTWVQGGVLEIEHSRSLGSGAIAVEGGLLRYLGTGTDTSSRVFYQNGANGTVDVVNASANLTFNNTSGSQGGSGAKLTKVGAGQLTLGNVNLSSGADVQAGTLQLGSSAGSGNAGGNISVSNAAILKYYTAAGGWIPLGNTVSGSGDLVFEGTGGSGVGDFGLSRASTNFSGTVRITNSRTWLTSGQAFGNASLVTIQQGGSVSLENVTLTNALSIAGNGWLEGSGNLGAIRLSGSSGVVA